MSAFKKCFNWLKQRLLQDILDNIWLKIGIFAKLSGIAGGIGVIILGYLSYIHQNFPIWFICLSIYNIIHTILYAFLCFNLKKNSKEKLLNSCQLIRKKANELFNEINDIWKNKARNLNALKSEGQFVDSYLPDFYPHEYQEYKEKLDNLDKEAQKILPQKYYLDFCRTPTNIVEKSEGNSLKELFLIAKSKVDSMDKTISEIQINF